MPLSTEQRPLEKLSSNASRWAGYSWAFMIALGITAMWLVSGPHFSFSNGWQLAMDTLCSVTTFLMVFLLHRCQLKDSLAMQMKLNEIIAALKGANNRLINIEDLSEQEIQSMRKRYQEIASQAKQNSNCAQTPPADESYTSGSKPAPKPSRFRHE